MMDLTGLFRVWNPQYKSWSVFGQDHLAKLLLNWDTSAGGHDAGAHA
jgi:RNA exonuclease 4